MFILLFKIGALVAKIKAFSERKWERATVKLVDIFDFFGSYINIELQNFILIRVLPGEKNMPWLLDLVKFWYFSLLKASFLLVLLRFFIAHLNLYDFCKLSFLASFRVLISFFRTSCLSIKITFFYYRRLFLSIILGDIGDLEAIVRVKTVSDRMDSFCFYFQERSVFFNDIDLVKTTTLVGAGISSFFDKFNALFLFYCNLRLEMPRLFLMLQLSKRINFIFSFGIKNYGVTLIWHLGNVFKNFLYFCQGKLKKLTSLFFSEKALFLYGQGLLERNDYYSIEYMLFFLRNKFMQKVTDIFHFFSSMSISSRLFNMLGLKKVKKWLLKKRLSLCFNVVRFSLKGIKKNIMFLCDFFFSSKKLLLFNVNLFEHRYDLFNFVFLFSTVSPHTSLGFDLFFPILSSVLTGGIYLNFLNNWFLNTSLNIFVKKNLMALSILVLIVKCCYVGVSYAINWMVQCLLLGRNLFRLNVMLNSFNTFVELLYLTQRNVGSFYKKPAVGFTKLYIFFKTGVSLCSKATIGVITELRLSRYYAFVVDFVLTILHERYDYFLIFNFSIYNYIIKINAFRKKNL